MSKRQKQQIVDTPNTHGMFMLGTGNLYLCHMPMFDVEDHRYQLILRARLNRAALRTFLADKAKHPDSPYNLINNDDDQFTLPEVAVGDVQAFQASVYRGYSGSDPKEKIVGSATVTVEQVVVFRHFNQNIPRPDTLTYILFGDGREAHLSHYIARDPDYQHLLTLPQVPDWLPVDQLKAGVQVGFIGMSSLPIPCRNPLTDDSYAVMFEGLEDTSETLQVGSAATVWFSTGNLLNAEDPCAGSTEMRLQASAKARNSR